jgi:hypothetical protein
MIHHAIVIVCLVVALDARKYAFVCACFAVSSAGHVTADVRWIIQTKTGVKCSPLDKTLAMCHWIVNSVCSVLPIPYMLGKIQQQYDLSFTELLNGGVKHVNPVYIAICCLIFAVRLAFMIQSGMREFRRINQMPYIPLHLKHVDPNVLDTGGYTSIFERLKNATATFMGKQHVVQEGDKKKAD